MEARHTPPRKDGRVIIHFDYDCFYAAVFEAKNPSLKSLPFAVQQKQIIVTCNYEARRRGLHKLQLVRDAKRICPEVVIELGEDISRFRDASKELYSFIRAYSWSGKVERLGFDEVWVDVTDMVSYNMEMLNQNSLAQSFFHISRADPLEGFAFDASSIAGHPYPKDFVSAGREQDSDLTLRLRLGSHLAQHIRHALEQQKGYTSTVGIATSKLLAKVVGNLNKPKGQTTVMPPLSADESACSNVTAFIDGHEIGKVPGIGFKLAQKLREHVLQRPATFDPGLVYGGTKEAVTVAAVRHHADINPETLEKLLSGPGSPHGIGYKIWCLLHGVDDSEVGQAKPVPSQISIEDSYNRLDTLPELLKVMNALAKSLLTRMRIDLLADDDNGFGEEHDSANGGATTQASHAATPKKWLARPKTLRLTTRPRQPLQPDGTRVRSFKRISHSGPLPTFVFGLSESAEALAEKLVSGALLGMFRRLHPEKSGWNLSLVNLAVTNMAETAGVGKTSRGRDISNMFRKQEDVLRDFRVTDTSSLLPYEVDITDVVSSDGEEREVCGPLTVASTTTTSAPDHHDGSGSWEEDGETDEENERCGYCGARMPGFALAAHQRFHSPFQ
ncbi:hypothetical protein LTR08_001809 [Meristemomyces frigidus]|nr:hypothetical protein LTR08_001809 [Meristemomyces frigidus]